MNMKIRMLLLVVIINSICFGQIEYNQFTRTALEQDLSVLSNKITSIHPLFLREDFRKDWDNKLKSTYKKLKDSMTQNEFYLVVSPLLSCLNDAHTNFLCPFEQRKVYMSQKTSLAFPFSVKIEGNSVSVSEYYGDDGTLFEGGEEILKINGIASSDICNEMRKLTGSKSISIRNNTAAMNFRSYLWMIYGFESHYELLVKDDVGETSNVHVKGITNDQYIQNRKRYQKTIREKYALVINSNKQIATMTIRSFADLDGFCAFADSAFQEIAENQIKSLIIDVRENGGGRSVVVDALMNYLTEKEYSLYQKIETRISDELKSYYKEKYPYKYDMIRDCKTDELVSTAGQTTHPVDKKFRYKGHLYLLVGNATFSGAATFAGVCKYLGLGDVIGEETGGTIEYFGDFLYITLPNSGLQFHVSPKRFVQYGGTDMDRGVKPDHIVADVNDAIIEFAYSLIDKQQNAGQKAENISIN